MAKRNRLIASTGSFPASVSVPSRPPQKTYVRAPSSTPDRKSTRLNSSHSQISYAVFCLKKKKHTRDRLIWIKRIRARLIVTYPAQSRRMSLARVRLLLNATIHQHRLPRTHTLAHDCHLL